mgnify:CR=1 FL=1|jgi:hypothetical protein
MKHSRHYWLIAMALLAMAVLFWVRQDREDSGETEGLARDPSALVYTKHARCRMDCRSISEEEVKQILLKGKINYSKSEPKAKPDPKYALEGKTDDGQRVRVVFAPDNGKVVVITAIDLDKEWPCNCN